jgi:hypothetical protein
MLRTYRYLLVFELYGPRGLYHASSLIERRRPITPGVLKAEQDAMIAQWALDYVPAVYKCDLVH